ncbi:WYL domain-containing protein [Pseudomonas sp.]|uniref:helix-turn-helix transcriptional regulator n=1 Tax=Pseudomonas sp. TaxID=306 RepID=UPI002908510A|nr:WYL domain-containing protein [Pseudomonas sp.]MDU4255479.1 WYL domain-containing protein [Pseudomonas sp.]
MEQLYRQDLILGLLPNKENALDSAAVHQRVTSQGLDVDKRTIQRDLSELELKYPHVHSRLKGSGKAKLWWADKSLSRLSMLPTDAMNLVMIMDHASRFGMAAQVQKLSTIREYAVSLLKGNRPAQDCTGKIVSNTRFVTLAPSSVDPDVLAVIQQALLDESSVKARYLKRGAQQPKELHLKPLGLSYQDSNIYLSCVFKGLPQDSIAALPLHRFLSARSTFEDLPAPENFDLNSIAAQKSLVGLKTDHPALLKLRVSQTLHVRLQENALTHDQQLEALTDGWWLMTGSLHLSQGLDLWLLSQGEHVEVLEPIELREQISETATRMAMLYKSQ